MVKRATAGNGADNGAVSAELGQLADHDLMQNTSKVVSSFVANNSVSANDLPVLIRSVADTFRSINAPQPAASGSRKPAVAIRKSVTPEYLVCLEDGKKLKMLKRHLRTAYNLSPADYRERWGLPADYPMVAPNYARQRSKLAKQIGLGTRARRKG